MGVSIMSGLVLVAHLRVAARRDEEVPVHHANRRRRSGDHDPVCERHRATALAARAGYPAALTAPAIFSALVCAASYDTDAAPIDTASTCTPGAPASACFTRATQCPQLMPSMASVNFSIVLLRTRDDSYTPHPYKYRYPLTLCQPSLSLDRIR